MRVRIVRLAVGVNAVVVPSERIVFVDPRLSVEEAVVAVWIAAPEVDPAEVRQSVREALR